MQFHHLGESLLSSWPDLEQKTVRDDFQFHLLPWYFHFHTSSYIIILHTKGKKMIYFSVFCFRERGCKVATSHAGESKTGTRGLRVKDCTLGSVQKYMEQTLVCWFLVEEPAGKICRCRYCGVKLFSCLQFGKQRYILNGCIYILIGTSKSHKKDLKWQTLDQSRIEHSYQVCQDRSSLYSCRNAIIKIYRGD